MERHTKVNRSITEGRAAFLKRLDGIQSGAECGRLAPLLSALADGEASAEDMAALRPHLRGCLACRATLREYRAAPKRVAALLPGPALLAGGGGSGWLESLFGAVSDRANALAMKAQSAVEIASAQKVAAVAASTAVLAGGGAAAVATLERPDRPAPRAQQSLRAGPTVPASAPAAAPPRATVVARKAERRGAAQRRRRAVGRAEEPPASATSEFDPTGNPPAPAAPAPPPPAGGRGGAPPPPDPATAEFVP